VGNSKSQLHKARKRLRELLPDARRGSSYALAQMAAASGD
jgi:hypothetical protein